MEAPERGNNKHLEEKLMEVVNIRDNPQYKERAVEYFQEKWASAESKPVYEDCISRSLVTKSVLPIWYLLMYNDEIVSSVMSRVFQIKNSRKAVNPPGIAFSAVSASSHAVL